MSKDIEEIRKECFKGSTQFNYDECQVKYTKALEQKIEELQKEVERLKDEDSYFNITNFCNYNSIFNKQ